MLRTTQKSPDNEPSPSLHRCLHRISYCMRGVPPLESASKKYFTGTYTAYLAACSPWNQLVRLAARTLAYQLACLHVCQPASEVPYLTGHLLAGLLAYMPACAPGCAPTCFPTCLSTCLHGCLPAQLIACLPGSPPTCKPMRLALRNPHCLPAFLPACPLADMLPCPHARPPARLPACLLVCSPSARMSRNATQICLVDYILKF